MKSITRHQCLCGQDVVTSSVVETRVHNRSGPVKFGTNTGGAVAWVIGKCPQCGEPYKVDLQPSVDKDEKSRV